MSLERLVAFVLALAMPKPAVAADSSGLRFVAILDESLDGAKRSSSSAEAELMRVMLAAKLELVDEKQSRELRRVTDVGTLISGVVPEVVTTLDADRIVAGVCRLSRITSDILPSTVLRYSAAVEVRLIAVDSARILASLRAQGEGIGHDREQAAANAARAAAVVLGKELLEALKQGSGRLEIQVTGVPDAASGERVVAGIGRIEGVWDVRVLQISRGVSKLSAAASIDARGLALAIDESRSSGVVVTGYSDRMVKAEWSAARASGLSFVAKPFRRVGEESGPPWVEAALSSAVAVELSALGIAPSDRFPESGWALVTEGSYRVRSTELEIDFLVATSAGVRLASTHARCEAASLSACARASSKELVKSLEARLSAGLEPFAAAPLVLGGPASVSESLARPLRVLKADVENLFPSRLAAYMSRSVGSLEVSTSKGLRDLTLTVRIPKFMKSLTTRFGAMAPGDRRELPVAVVLDRDSVSTHEENLPVIVAIELEYDSEGLRFRHTLGVSVVLYAKNALSWTEPDSIAAFVTPQASTIQELARRIAREVASTRRTDPLGTPVALFRGLGSLGIGYTADPRNESDTLDYLQYPEQTLSRNGGDCDDLAVLYSAAAEAIGLRTLLLTTPGHVFVAVGTGLPVQAAHLLDLPNSGERLVVHDGLLWIPLETTRLGQSFSLAWLAGSDEWARWKDADDKVRIIDVRKSWTRYPALSLVESSSARAFDFTALAPLVTQELDGIDERRSEAVSAELGRLESSSKGSESRTERSRLRRKAFFQARVGLAQKAESLLRELLEADAGDEAALNDLGNLKFVRGEIAEARQLYGRAVAHASKATVIPIRLNAALAALADDDEREFGKQITACLDAGAESEILALATAGVPSPGDRGARDLGVRDLSVALITAIERSGRAGPSWLRDLGTTSSNSGALALDRYLHWIAE